MTETSTRITLNHPFKIGQGDHRQAAALARDSHRSGEISVRGEMVAGSTWQLDRIQQHNDPWPATGAIVPRDDEGQLRFVGRNSEIICTPAGLNASRRSLPEPSFQ